MKRGRRRSRPHHANQIRRTAAIRSPRRATFSGPSARRDPGHLLSTALYEVPLSAVYCNTPLARLTRRTQMADGRWQNAELLVAMFKCAFCALHSAFSLLGCCRLQHTLSLDGIDVDAGSHGCGDGDRAQVLTL